MLRIVFLFIVIYVVNGKSDYDACVECNSIQAPNPGNPLGIYGYCPSIQGRSGCLAKSLDGLPNKDVPLGGDCPGVRFFGAWVGNISQCECFKETNQDCSSCSSKSSCGFCPTYNKCYPGNLSGPVDYSNKFQCPSDTELGSWVKDENECQCNPISKTKYTMEQCTSSTVCGYCGRTGQCVPGSQSGPKTGECENSNTNSSYWVWGKESLCFNKNLSCSECSKLDKCGYCPTQRMCMVGDSFGPRPNYFDLTCQDNIQGLWTKDPSQCSCWINKSLNNTDSCQQCTSSPNCGMCFVKGRGFCWIGNFNGPTNFYEKRAGPCTNWKYSSCSV